ncbi:urease accessory protein UreD [Phycisphaera mikurensis]|uniref:Urease accessory protein UreD n=1 Tax=Phycisphaera mikurensis (strain NBRC 102666 / KCTC 22515 / FYK2301M01) TaxID=1142394 RepID=I0IDP7_PHYMF|nr:urease accessory protein UreD [Phycisphaera mikurensis]MBB6441202.1 urease accessory protein [Phycisphaera mikurensis]BAM03385.1 urease accessory protein UreD [Phycisphaera mikurensis NBRC 102666]
MHATPRIPSTAGTGRARVERVAGRSVVTSSYATSPMKLLTPRTAGGGAASVVVSGFGGGILSGDTLSLDLDVGPAAVATLGTQASTKIFHADAEGRPATQRLGARVAAEGFLAVLPDPVVCFADAAYEQRQRFDLEDGAGLVLLDAFTAGRVARSERWRFRRFASRNEVFLRGRLLLHEALELRGEDAADELVTGGFDAFATLAFAGSAAADPEVAGWLGAVSGRRPRRGDAVRVSAGRVGDRPLVTARFAGPSAEHVHAELRAALGCVATRTGTAFGDRRF